MASKGIEKLVLDAELAGCKVTRINGRIQISKKGLKSISLIITEDGTAYRGDVDLTISTTIRTQKEMRRVLNLNAVKTVKVKRFTVVINGEGGYSHYKVNASYWIGAQEQALEQHKIDNPQDRASEVGVAAVIEGWPGIWC